MLIPSSFCLPPMVCIEAIGNGAAFHKGREFAAWLGVVPGKRYQPLAGFVLARRLLGHRIGLVDSHFQMIKLQLQLSQQHA